MWFSSCTDGDRIHPPVFMTPESLLPSQYPTLSEPGTVPLGLEWLEVRNGVWDTGHGAQDPSRVKPWGQLLRHRRSLRFLPNGWPGPVLSLGDHTVYLGDPCQTQIGSECDELPLRISLDVPGHLPSTGPDLCSAAPSGSSSIHGFLESSSPLSGPTSPTAM